MPLRKRGATPPPALSGVRHLPGEAEGWGLGAGARPHGKGRLGPGPSASPPPPPAPPRGLEPGPEVSARRRQARQGPSSGSRGLARGGRDAQPPPSRARRASPAASAPAPAPAPRPSAAPAGRFTHLAPPPRLPHVTARPRAPRHRQRDRGRTPRDPARPPPPLGSSPGRRQRTCCAACHGSSGSTAPPQPHNNMAAAASAGSRGAGRQATGRAADGPPARGRHRLPHPREPKLSPGAAPYPRNPGAPDPAGLVPVPRSPLGEALKPRSRQPFSGAATAHLAPPPRGDMLRLGGAFPAPAEPPKFRGRPSRVGHMPVAPHMGLSPERSLALRLVRRGESWASPGKGI
uniref:Basic proline-rich protein-like n=1 Tax=Callorhinus ursinus TaxID=34884 RepID=A0A3Q7NSX2_CALUR|nr:basic proline-rich protein-like [Callorhinus ursinus]